MNRFGIWLTCAALTASALTTSAAASPTQAIENNKGICESAARHLEQVEDIPAHLLVAISLTETGRWDADDAATFAWPWTVTAKGKGNYYPSRATAVAAVRQLQAQGVTNIDVGCMQINLRYHPDAFANLNQAFDPTINTAYASGFLLDRYKTEGSWTEAAAAYHSKTPKYARKYKMKVLKLWNEARARATPLPAEPAPVQTAATSPEPLPARGRPFQGGIALPADTQADTIDQSRSAFLNAAMKARRAGDAALKKAETRMNQLDAWRSKQFADDGRHLAVMQRAEKLAHRRLQRAGVRPREDTFAEKRQNQLSAWRAGLPPAPNVSTIDGSDS